MTTHIKSDISFSDVALIESEIKQLNYTGKVFLVNEVLNIITSWRLQAPILSVLLKDVVIII